MQLFLFYWCIQYLTKLALIETEALNIHILNWNILHKFLYVWNIDPV